MKALFFFIALLVTPAFAQAATRYIDNASTGCSNPDTDYDPGTRTCGSGSDTVHSTMVAALNAGTGGDVFILMPGTYSESFTFTGAKWARTSWETATIVKGFTHRTAIITPSGSAFQFNGDNDGTFTDDPAFMIVGGDSVGLIIRGTNIDNEGSGAIAIRRGSHHIRIHGNQIEDFRDDDSNTISCFNDAPGQGANFCEIIDNDFDNLMGTNNIPTGGFSQAHYISGGSAIVRGNTYTNIFGHAVRMEHSDDPSQVSVIEDNDFFNVQGFCIQHRTPGGIVRRNTMRECGTSEKPAIRIMGANFVYNNTVYNSGSGGIQTGETFNAATNVTIKNNIMQGNGGLGDLILYGSNHTVDSNYIEGTITNNSSGSTITNTVTLDPQLVDPDNGNYNPAAGSRVIDACVDVGLPFNGDAPDCGAIEFAGDPGDPPVGGFASATVETATPNTVNGLFQSTVDPVTDCSAADFTVNVATVNRNSGTFTHTGPSSFTLTFDGSAVTSGQAVTLAYAGTSCVAGAATIATWTAAAVDNNVDDPSGHSFTNQTFRFRVPRGTSLADDNWRLVEGQNITLPSNAIFRIAFKIKCTDGPCPPTPIALGSAKNGGEQSAVDETCGSGGDAVCMYGTTPESDMPSDGAALAQRLGAGTFVGGQYKRRNNVMFTTPEMATDEEFEMEWSAQLDSADLTTGDFVDLYMWNDLPADEVLCSASCSVPRITIRAAQASSGF